LAKSAFAYSSLQFFGFISCALARFEISQNSNTWASIFTEEAKTGAAVASPKANGAQWTKWFGSANARALEGKVVRTQRNGCAIVACYGQRFKNMIGMC
jgi:hypothetical protein